MKKAVEGRHKFYKNQCGKASKGLRGGGLFLGGGANGLSTGGVEGGDFKPTNPRVGTGMEPGKTMVRRYLLVTSGANRHLVGPAPSFVSRFLLQMQRRCWRRVRFAGDRQPKYGQS